MKDQSGSMLLKAKMAVTCEKFQSLVFLQSEGSSVVH